MNAKEIREWYQSNGMEYIPEDWDESLPQRQERERFGADDARVLPLPPERFEDTAVPLWAQPRSQNDREYMETLEDFFQPYIAMLPRPKGELLRQMMNDQKTFAQIAEDEGRASRGSTINAGKRALQSLVRLIAEDDDQFVAPLDGRRRDYESEQAAAQRVFKRYLIRKGYSA